MKLTRREGLVATAALALAGVARADDDDGIGGVEDIVNYAWSTLAPEPRDEIELEDDVYMNEVVETGEESALVVKFSDGSKLTLGENAKIVIDTYVFDPATFTGEQAVTLSKGAFRFLSGSLPKTSVKISTPAVTIGIRGTELVIDVADDGETEMSTLSGEADATDGSGETLTVAVDESVVIDRNRRFRGRVRKRRHVSRSIAIAEGLEGARVRWRIRKPAKRRAIQRRRKRRAN
jgi:hypothetical protein